MKRLIWVILALLFVGSAQAQLLLDTRTNAMAAYSLRLIDQDFADSKVVIVERSSDAAQDSIGFSGGTIDTTAMKTFCGTTASDQCYVIEWFSQITGHPPLKTDFLNPISVPNATDPRIMIDGVVVRDNNGKIGIDFAGDAMLFNSTAFPSSVDLDSSSVFVKFQKDSLDAGVGGYEPMLQFGNNTAAALSYTWQDASWLQLEFRQSSQSNPWVGYSSYLTYTTRSALVSYHVSGQTSDTTKAYDRHSLIEAIRATEITDHNRSNLGIGGETKNNNEPQWNGKFQEILVFPYLISQSEIHSVYDDMNAYWEVGPTGYHPNALLPQGYNGDIVFYDWFEAHNDTTLFSFWSIFPNTATDTIAVWDNNASYTNDLSDDQIASKWLELEGAALSSATRYEPSWYILDDGAGKGIEATGSVKVIHEPTGGGSDPFGGGYEGNPPRSWANEPCFWYQFDLPRPGLSNGNKLYKQPVLARRAISIALQDMMMYRDYWTRVGGYANWPDMHGRALLSWAEVFRDCGEILDAATSQAYQDLMLQSVNKVISFPGARAVNTNLDMFMINAMATIYGTPGIDPTLKTRAAEAINITLLGYTDGVVGSKHKLFNAGTHQVTGEPIQGGVWGPAGYIMEGDQPEIFYLGESKMHLSSALAKVMDRATQVVPAEVEVLKAAVDSIGNFEMYQMFYDLGGDSPCCGGLITEKIWSGGAGFAARTGAPVPSGQTNGDATWRDVWSGFMNEQALWRSFPSGWQKTALLPSISAMKSAISSDMSGLNSSLKTAITTSDPGGWDGFSPWIYPRSYIPPIGWYKHLQLWNTFAPQFKDPPPARAGYYYSRALGGYPAGPDFWAYKDSTAGIDFGWFVEAMPDQGTYGGWYGGKLETFWTSHTGILIMNRHGKTGCDGEFEDSGCWNNLDVKAGHHVWGRDDLSTGNGFTTLLLRGHDLDRTSTMRTGAGVGADSVVVLNHFNDSYYATNPTSSRTGEQTGSEIEGTTFDVKNKLVAISNGIQVTHSITTSQEDSLSMLYASIPVFLRHWNSIKSGDKPQANMSDTTIERDSSGVWVSMPTWDNDSDGYPDHVTTQYVRLGRDYNDGVGSRYGYIDFTQPESIRLGDSAYEDPYQTVDRFRQIHIDLHGSPGTNILSPASASVTYKIVVTDPTL